MYKNVLRLYTLFVIIVYKGLSLVEAKDEFGVVETGLRVIYNNYKQCETESKDVVTCFKLKAVKLADRILSVNNIPITEGISLTKREEKSPRSIDNDGMSSSLNDSREDTNLPTELGERNQRLDQMLSDRLYKFVESRSLQFRINQLFSTAGNDNNDVTEQENSRDGRGKKDKNKGMYMYMMMMKGGMLALAYKGLALLAGKALLVSKIALMLALLVAAKKLFSHGHSAKTTYEIVKTPIITHSHQYAANAAATHGHYGAAAGDFSSYDGSPYARSLDTTMDESASNRNVNYRLIEQPTAYRHSPTTKYATHIIETIEGRSLSSSDKIGRSLFDKDEYDEGNRKILKQFPNENDKIILGRANALPPYAHLAAYRKQLNDNSNLNNRISSGKSSDKIHVVVGTTPDANNGANDNASLKNANSSTGNENSTLTNSSS